MTQADRNALIEDCAVAAEQQDRSGREWVHDSLWANILKRAGNNVRLLKTTPITKPGHELSALRQAIIENSRGDSFWLGEILLDVLEKETGFSGSQAVSVAESNDGMNSALFTSSLTHPPFNKGNER